MATQSNDRKQRGPATDVHIPVVLDGRLLLRLFGDGCELLSRHIEAVNAVNVYPVPDGDTGTNMHLTLRAGIDEMERSAEADVPSADVSSAASSLADGALMGARGNSGVILSQILRGFASALDGRSEAGGAALAAALSAGSTAAYAALSEPVEGTILTVMREAAEGAEAERGESIERVLARAVDAAHASVERTPELLPVLREAGVVDAGGLGLAIILEGLLRSLRGDSLDIDLTPASAVQANFQSASLHSAREGDSGYCTEFVVSAQRLDSGAVREHMTSLGTSVLVVGGEGLLRVHLHTTTPDDALAYGRSLGELSQAKVDNLEEQIRRFAGDAAPPQAVASGVGIVAIAAGEGIAQAFRSVGATNVVEGGQTMNPSAGEILKAIEGCQESEVVVLPNNKNIIAAAEQAAGGTSKRVAVIPSRTIPQGIAAVLALSSEVSFETNEAAMAEALGSVRSAEVTRAVRATTIDGKPVAVGQAIGIIDGSLHVVADQIVAAAEACVAEIVSADASLLTIYSGQDVRDEEAASLAASLRKQHPALEIEVVAGGQPHYPYILSLE